MALDGDLPPLGSQELELLLKDDKPCPLLDDPTPTWLLDPSPAGKRHLHPATLAAAAGRPPAAAAGTLRHALHSLVNTACMLGLLQGAGTRPSEQQRWMATRPPL